MTPRTSKGVLVVMGPMGWLLACVFGALACMLAADARGHDLPWQILGSLVLGSTLAAAPIGVTLWAAYRLFGGHPPSASLVPPESIQQAGGVSWRWTTFAAMVAYLILFVPLGLVLLYRETAGRKLVLSPQFRLKQMLAAMVMVCIASALARLAASADDELRVAVAMGLGMLVAAGMAVSVGAGSWAKWFAARGWVRPS